MRKNIFLIFIITIIAGVLFTLPASAQKKCLSGKIFVTTCGECIDTNKISGSCSSPDQGQWLCGNCVCPPGTTNYDNRGICVPNCLSDQIYKTGEGCKEAIRTTPAVPQPGVVNVGSPTANAKLEDKGNLILNGSSATGEGNIYLNSGKAIQVNFAGATELNVGNWGGGAFTMNVTGDIKLSGSLIDGNVPWARLNTFPSVCPAGQFVTGIGKILTCATSTAGAGYLPGSNIVINNGTDPYTIGVKPNPSFATLTVSGMISGSRANFTDEVKSVTGLFSSDVHVAGDVYLNSDKTFRIDSPGQAQIYMANYNTEGAGLTFNVGGYFRLSESAGFGGHFPNPVWIISAPNLYVGNGRDGGTIIGAGDGQNAGDITTDGLLTAGHITTDGLLTAEYLYSKRSIMTDGIIHAGTIDFDPSGQSIISAIGSYPLMGQADEYLLRLRTGNSPSPLTGTRDRLTLNRDGNLTISGRLSSDNVYTDLGSSAGGDALIYGIANYNEMHNSDYLLQLQASSVPSIGISDRFTLNRDGNLTISGNLNIKGGVIETTSDDRIILRDRVIATNNIEISGAISSLNYASFGNGSSDDYVQIRSAIEVGNNTGGGLVVVSDDTGEVLRIDGNEISSDYATGLYLQSANATPVHTGGDLDVEGVITAGSSSLPITTSYGSIRLNAIADNDFDENAEGMLMFFKSSAETCSTVCTRHGLTCDQSLSITINDNGSRSFSGGDCTSTGIRICFCKG